MNAKIIYCRDLKKKGAESDLFVNIKTIPSADPFPVISSGPESGAMENQIRMKSSTSIIPATCFSIIYSYSTK